MVETRFLLEPNGFKETEIGSIPTNWEVVPLGRAIEHGKSTLNPQSFPDEMFDYYSIPAYQVSDKPILERGGEIRSQKLLIESGTVLFGKLNPRVAKVWRVTSLSSNRKIASTEFIPLSPIEGKTGSEFLYYLAWSDYILPRSQELVSGSTPSRQRVDVPAFLNIPIPLPPLDEQRRIAHILNTIQREIAAQDKLIAAAREVKRSLMQRLFTYGPGAEPAPTKETEIGEAPEHWEVVRLGKVARIGNGSTPKRTNPAYWKGGTIPWLTSGKVHERIIQEADEFVTDLAKEECHLPVVPRGSIVVAITGQGKTLGNAALVTFDTCVNQHLAYIQFRDSPILPEFVLAFLQQQYEDLRQASQAGGSTKGALTCGFLMNYPIPLPPVEEQCEIAHIIWAVDRKIAAEEQRKSALQALFKSMLHQLMTGQLRAKDMGGLI